MKFYIIDTTLNNKPVYYNTPGEVVRHLENTVKRKFNQTRQVYMQNLIDLGYGADDPTGKTFVESLSKYFDIGVVKQLRHVKCNIHEVAQYSNYRSEMGD